MRTVPAAITAARQSSSSRLCKIWEITRTDGVVLRFTEHNRDLVIGGETYRATASFDPSTIKAGADMSVGDLDVQGAFDTEYVTAEDLLAGRYWGASFFVAEVLWDDLAAGTDVLKTGWIGTVREIGGKFLAELLDLNARLQQTIGEVYSQACRATLGDSRCGVVLSSYAGTVVAATSRRVFSQTIASAQYEGFFQFGRLTWTSGANDGLSMDVQAHDGDTVSLFLPMPFDVTAGDTFTMVGGCDKSLAMCRGRWNNVLNFRGEPHAPVNDDLIRGPGPDVNRASGGGGADISPAPTPEPDVPLVPTITGAPQISDT